MSKNKKTTEDIEVLEGEVLEDGLLPFNPLMGSPIISVGNENEQKVNMINEIETLADINKQQLMVKRQRAELIVDNKKLDTAIKTIDTVDKIINAVSSEEVLMRVTENIKTPMDLKMMAEAAERLTGTLKNLMNPNVADELGNRKHHKINMMFKGQGAVQIEIPKD